VSIRLAACLQLASVLRELSVWAKARADALTARATRLNLSEINNRRKRRDQF
jgi:hypothetical protein